MQFCLIRKSLHWSKTTKMLKTWKFQNCLNQLKREKHPDEDISEPIRPFAAITPTLYGLPKTHKEACPCRPILASNDCFNYKYALWLNKIFNPLRKHPTNLKDMFEFAALNKIQLWFHLMSKVI